MDAPADFEAQIRFTCPFCGGEASAGEKDGKPALLHTLPTCKEFEENEIDEFLFRSRMRIQSQRGIGEA